LGEPATIRNKWHAMACWLLPALLLLKLAIAPEANAASWSERWQALTRPTPAPAAIVMDDASQTAVAAARELSGEMLIVWPNESFLAQAAGKVNPTYTLQSFMAMTPALEQATIERYDRLQETPVLLVRLGEDLDRVSHVARAPLVFRHLIEHYERSGQSNAAFAILNQTATTDRGWQAHEVPLPKAGIIAKLSEGNLAKSHDVRASDLLLLKVSTSRLPRNPLAKAARLLMRLTLDSGEHRARFVPLVQGEQQQTIGVSYLEPAEDLFVETYFGPEVTTTSERITKIELAWMPTDFLTPLPDEFIVHQLEYLRREGAPAKTVPVNVPAKQRVP